MISQTAANLIAFIGNRLKIYKMAKSLILQDIFLLRLMRRLQQ